MQCRQRDIQLYEAKFLLVRGLANKTAAFVTKIGLKLLVTSNSWATSAVSQPVKVTLAQTVHNLTNRKQCIH